MVIVIGGRSHGKLDFVKNHTKNYINNYHLLIDEHNDFLNYTKENINTLKNQVIIVEEVGLGIVPLEKELRQKRDDLGRVYQYLCSEAEVVIRIWYGLVIYVKGNEERFKKIIGGYNE